MFSGVANFFCHLSYLCISGVISAAVVCTRVLCRNTRTPLRSKYQCASCAQLSPTHSSVACPFRGLTFSQSGSSEASRTGASCSSDLSRSPACSSSVSARCRSAHRGTRAPAGWVNRLHASQPLPNLPYPLCRPMHARPPCHGLPASAPPLLPPCSPRALAAAWPATGGLLGLGLGLGLGPGLGPGRRARLGFGLGLGLG